MSSCSVVATTGLALALVGCGTPPAEEKREPPAVDPAAVGKCPYSAEMRAGSLEAGKAAPSAVCEGMANPPTPAGPHGTRPHPARPHAAASPGPAPRGPTSGDEAPSLVREASAAGEKNFYTSDPQELRKQVSGYVAAAKKVKLPGRVIAIIAPHAGYGFSGAAAGWAYKQLEGEDIETVILIGGHAADMPRAYVWEGSYRSPLGLTTPDLEVLRHLMLSGNEFGAEPAADNAMYHGSRDHALEVQIPFIQVVLPRAKIVPIYFNTSDASLAARVGEFLARVMKGRKVAIVASTDLSHYPDAETAAVVDRAILDAIVSLDTKRIVEADRRLMATYRAKNLSCTVCGMGGVIAMVEAAKRLGAKGARLIAYDHSGNHVRKDRTRVVGYGALAIYGAPAPVPAPVPAASRVPGRMFTDQEHAMLLSLARMSIDLAFKGKELPQLAGLPPALGRKAAAFVTLTNGGRLRGCMGTFDRSGPIWKVVADRARAAAFRDPRQGLGDVTKDELARIEIEISVLSDPRKLADPLSIELGRDGILLRSADGLKGGTYLPQVGEDFKTKGKTKEEFLSHCCANKVGLPADAWRDPKLVTVFAYTAEVFSEGELRAKAGKPGEAGR